MSLFRPEALEAKSHNAFGNLRLGRSLSGWLITAVVLALATAVVAFGLYGEASRKTRVVGLLLPVGGAINLTAPVGGRLQRVAAIEGQVVHAGDALFVIDLDHQSASGVTAALVASQLQTRLASLVDERRQRQAQAALRHEALAERLRNLVSEKAKLDEEITLQSRRKALAKTALAQQENLAAARFISNAHLNQAQEQLIDQDARFAGLERQRLSLKRDQIALSAELAQVNGAMANEIASLDRSSAALEQEIAENAGRREMVITASHDGRVTASPFAVGQTVLAGQSLATLQPAGTELEAQLYAPSRAIGFVQNGQAAQLRLDAYPYQKFGLQQATVSSVSESALAPNELPPAVQARYGSRLSGEALYRITLRLARQSIAVYGKEEALKSGLAVEADIVQERRRIVEWMFEPILAFAQRQAGN
ncbi:MAG: HlyD family efflux transporter periplasmic adaptor subunit [Rhodocyclaceae bacterium]|nr:HlyD family efflux transporter periplasmic adaptor subunit [Rhodocyclaceae bacterium]